MSSDIQNSGLDKKERKGQNNSIIKLLVATQAVTVLVIYLLLCLYNLNILKYVLIFDIILSAAFVLNLRAEFDFIKSKLRTTASLYAILDAILFILIIISSGELMERVAKENDLVLYIFATFLSIVLFIIFVFILYKSKRITHLKDVSHILIIGILYNLLDSIEILPEDIKSFIRLFLGIIFTVALIKLILDMIGISLPGSIALLGANKAAIILAGILQIGFWKNESIIKEELGLENYQMIILFILFIPISVFFELAIEIFLKKLYKLISQNWSLSENYKSVIYIIMVYISAIFITMSGLAKEDPEKYVFNMLSNPFVIIALIIIAIISKFIPIYLRTHNVSLKKGMALILTISVILVFGLYAHSPIDSDNDSEKDAYAITVNYNGSWIGSIYDGTNRTEITGTGNPKVPFEVIKLPITIDIQKIDGDYGILTVDILRNGEKIKTGVVQAGYTSVQIDLTQYDIKK